MTKAIDLPTRSAKDQSVHQHLSLDLVPGHGESDNMALLVFHGRPPDRGQAGRLFRAQTLRRPESEDIGLGRSADSHRENRVTLIDAE